jgi:cytochrome c oxidase accessory protein FixG
VVCPYGRLQGALYDQDTVVVGYDRRRGEPRGPAGQEGAGACVDCFRCVAVCPTGIDIRNGTQMECVGCANCIDACDEVMTRLDRPTGLVRYDSERAFAGGRRRFFRPRVLLYAVLLAVGAVAFTFASMQRTPFDANLVRMSGPGFVLDGDAVQNSFNLHLVNKLPEAATFTLEPQTDSDGEMVLAQREVRLESLADVRLPVFVRVPRQQFQPGLAARLRISTGELSRMAASPLVGPANR